MFMFEEEKESFFLGEVLGWIVRGRGAEIEIINMKN
jgi:hypothetical protein